MNRDILFEFVKKWNIVSSNNKFGCSIKSLQDFFSQIVIRKS